MILTKELKKYLIYSVAFPCFGYICYEAGKSIFTSYNDMTVSRLSQIVTEKLEDQNRLNEIRFDELDRKLEKEGKKTDVLFVEIKRLQKTPEQKQYIEDLKNLIRNLTTDVKKNDSCNLTASIPLFCRD